MPRRLTVFLVVLSSLLATSCTPSDRISVSGSTTVLPVVSVAAEQFRLKNPDVKIVVNAGGSGVGINQLGQGNIDIGMSSRSITASEIAKYPHTKFVTHVVGRDAVVPVVSSEIFDAGVTALSLAQIGDIYKGSISNWQQLGGPDRDILVIDKEQSRGTRHVFMNAVFGDEEALAPGADMVLGSNNEEQTAVVQSDAAIGMLSNAWMNKDVRGLWIKTPNGTAIEPSKANLINGSFPISRSLLLVTNGEAKGNAREFLDFILSDQGQKIVEESGYARNGR